MSESMEKRIKRLLALAEDERGNEHERELAAKQAERLMLRWGIERAKLEASLNDDEREQIVVKYTQPFPKLFIKARMSLANSICIGMGNLKLWIAGNVCAVMGFESDVDRALTLIQSLLVQNDLALAEWWSQYPDRRFLTSQQALLARRQFIFGFGNTVRDRLTLMRDEEVHDSDLEGGKSTALVLLDRGALVDAEYDAKFSRGMKRGRSLKGSAHGGAAGRAAGARANLGQTGIGGRPRGVLGG